jgi:outer membrane receptor for ferrienterochelin and colicins
MATAMCRGIQVAVAAVGICLTTVGPIAAQDIDYGTFEELFGEPVTTSATGTPQRTSDVPANMEIITAEMIRRSGATDIPDVLSHVVGVDVLRWGVSSADVSIRGYDSPFSPRLLVLVNGRQVYLDDWGRTEWDAIPVQLAEIRQIEIVKGPNTALFGFNAAAGVINIITYNPLYDTVNTASVAGGTQGFAQASVVGTAHIGPDAAVLISAGLDRSNEFGSLRATAQQLGLPQRTVAGSFSIDARVRIDADQEFEIEATHSALDHLEITPIWTPDWAVYETTSIKGKYSITTDFGLIEAVAYTNFLNESGDFLNRNDELTAVSFNNQKTVLQLQDQFKLGAAHVFRVSVEYQHSMMNTSPVAGGTVGYDIGSASAMWQWQIVPELSLTQAVRIDVLWLGRTGSILAGIPVSNAQWNRQITEPSFNSGLVYHPTAVDTLRLMAARGVQLPSLLGFGAFQAIEPVPLFGTSVAYSGVPSINPTVVMNYEVDWDHQLPQFNTVLRAAVFYQTSDSLQNITTADLTPLSNGMLFNSSGNIGNSAETGIELSAKGTLPGGWHWSVGYSPRLVRDDLLPTQPPVDIGVDFAHMTPRHVVDVAGGWSQGPWEIDLAARFQSSIIGFQLTPDVTFIPVRVDSYLTVDIRLAYKIVPGITVSVVGRSITSGSQQQTSIGTVDRRVLGGIQMTF